MMAAADCGATAAAALRYEGATAAECMPIGIPPQSPYLVREKVTTARTSRRSQGTSSWTALRSLLDDEVVLARARTIHEMFPVGIFGLEWMSEAACALDSVNPDVFHPDKADSQVSLPIAKRTCLACSVRTECLDYIDRIESDLPRARWAGVWGAESVRERGRRRAEAREEVLREASA